MTSSQESVPTTSPADVSRFREVLGRFASGITVITGTSAGDPLGFTCQSFYSVSMDPPLISISVMRSSTTYPAIRETGRFAVNVLSENQHGVSGQFARSGTNKWAGVRWEPGPSGNPRIEDALAWLDCEIWAEHAAGDHLVVIGRITSLEQRGGEGGNPLIFFRGQYRRLVSS